MPYCVPPGLHPSFIWPAWSLKIFEQCSPWAACSVCPALSWVQGKVEYSLSPRSGWLDMPSERAAYNVRYIIRRLCDVKPEDTELRLELGLHVELGWEKGRPSNGSLPQQVWGGKKGLGFHRMERRPFCVEWKKAWQLHGFDSIHTTNVSWEHTMYETLTRNSYLISYLISSSV